MLQLHSLTGLLLHLSKLLLLVLRWQPVRWAESAIDTPRGRAAHVQILRLLRYLVLDGRSNSMERSRVDAGAWRSGVGEVHVKLHGQCQVHIKTAHQPGVWVQQRQISSNGQLLYLSINMVDTMREQWQ